MIIILIVYISYHHINTIFIIIKNTTTTIFTRELDETSEVLAEIVRMSFTRRECFVVYVTTITTFNLNKYKAREKIEKRQEITQ